VLRYAISLPRLTTLIAEDGILEDAVYEQHAKYGFTQRTVNFAFATNAFCFSTESALTPTIRAFARLKFSFSLSVCNWQASLVHPNDPASKTNINIRYGTRDLEDNSPDLG
jgi:hypothetical protein